MRVVRHLQSIATEITRVDLGIRSVFRTASSTDPVGVLLEFALGYFPKRPPLGQWTFLSYVDHGWFAGYGSPDTARSARFPAVPAEPSPSRIWRWPGVAERPVAFAAPGLGMVVAQFVGGATAAGLRGRTFQAAAAGLLARVHGADIHLLLSGGERVQHAAERILPAGVLALFLQFR